MDDRELDDFRPSTRKRRPNPFRRVWWFGLALVAVILIKYLLVNAVSR